jgi:glycosyltransferase involved in cell wall biosynthesis
VISDRGQLIDLTRLVSRLGRGPLTGIDRVEAAYLQRFLSQNGPLFGLVRSRIGYLLLDRHGCAALWSAQNGSMDLPKIGPVARFLARDPRRSLAESLARKLAIARSPGFLLSNLLRKLPSGLIYWNLGHVNLTVQTLSALCKAKIKIAVLIHDTIPLDHPEFCRPQTVAPFARKIAVTARYADWVVHVSKDARHKTERHFASFGRVPAGVTAHLGVTVAAAEPIAAQRPYFVVLGTIEPRKNHAFLFDLWDQMDVADTTPQLWVIGSKGWASADVFAKMDRLIAKNLVIHHPNLEDAAAMAALQGAQGLLFPSLAEGFGLPPAEAAALGRPVIANDLPVIKEVMGEFAVYLDVADSYSWGVAIGQLCRNEKRLGHAEYIPPNWSQHFNITLTMID